MTQASESTKTLQESTVVLEVIFHKPGMRRKGDLDRVETPASKKRLSLSKAILDSPEYREIETVARQCREDLEAFELESPFGRGRHLVTLDLLEQAYERVNVAEADYLEAVEHFLIAYPARVAQSKDALADQYDARNYVADPEKLRPQFWVERRVLSWDTPGQSKIGEYLYSQEQNRLQKEMAGVVDDAKFALRAGIKNLATKLADSLGQREDGRKKQLRHSTYGRLMQWIENFNARNVLQDDELQAVVSELRSVMDGKAVQELRTNEGLRQQVKKQLETAGTKLTALLVDAPTRAISLGDE